MKLNKIRIGIKLISILLMLTFFQACKTVEKVPDAEPTTQSTPMAPTNAALETETANSMDLNENDSSAQEPVEEETLEIMENNMPSTEQTSAITASNNASGNLSELFTYDSSKPINIQELSSEETLTGVTVREISYNAYDNSLNPDGIISAYMITPEGEGPFPCILYFHWLGSMNSNKKEFLEEATSLAEQGIAGFLIDGVFPWRQKPAGLLKDKAMVVYQVIEVSRALDYITTLPYIDQERIGYVGHDYGAMYGALLSGIDKRINCYVFIAGMGNFTDWFVKYWPHRDEGGNLLNEAGIEDYRQEMAELDPVNYIKDTAPASIFFQFANTDKFITKEVADEFYEAASLPKEVLFYEGAHEMESEQARLDREEWLLEKLK